MPYQESLIAGLSVNKPVSAMPGTGIADEELVTAIQAGDQGALGELIARYEDRVYFLSLRLLGNEQDAEDVLQETFISVIKNLPGFRGDSGFATWLFRIATNNALMQLRKRKRSAVNDDLMEFDLDGNIAGQAPIPIMGVNWSAHPSVALLRKETYEQMDQAINRLPESLRAVFILRDIEGLATGEVAGILGISLAAVKSRLHRARLFLRDSLSVYFGRKDGTGHIKEET